MRNLEASLKHSAIMTNLETLLAYMQVARAFWKMLTLELRTVHVVVSLLPCTRGSVFLLLVDTPQNFTLCNCIWTRGASSTLQQLAVCQHLLRSSFPGQCSRYCRGCFSCLAQILKDIQIILSPRNQWKLGIKILSRSWNAVSKYDFVPEHIKTKVVAVSSLH